MARDILVIEDDPEIGAQICESLVTAGYRVDHAATLSQANGYLNQEKLPELLILDRLLPDGEGLEFLARARARGFNVPTLILSALGEIDDKIRGLDDGADDYLTKPFDFQELLARVAALLRRAGNTSDVGNKLTFGSLCLDLIEHRAFRENQDLQLQPREFKLLAYFIRNAGEVVTRSMLLKEIWGLDFDPQTNVVEVHVSRLRAKLDKGHEQRLLHTVRGAGYILRA